MNSTIRRLIEQKVSLKVYFIGESEDSQLRGQVTDYDEGAGWITFQSSKPGATLYFPVSSIRYFEAV